MAANKLNVGMLANVASDGNEGVSDQHVLTYVAANNSVEFKELNLSISGTGTVSSNADSVNTSTASDIDTVQDNVATTLTSLDAANTSIDTVEANLATFAAYANTNYASDAANSFATITVGEANVVASGTSNTLVFTSGNGISVTANAASQSITFDVNIGNVASEYYVLDGTANTVTLSKDYRPANTLYVTVGGLVQEPGINYITDSTTLTLINTYPILNGTDVEVRYLPYTGEIAASASSGPSHAQGSLSGYTSGGSRTPASPAFDTRVDKFPFSSDTSATEVGNLTAGRRELSGQSSTTHGYSSGGSAPDGYKDFIDKFPFSSDTNATDVGDLTLGRAQGAGQSSTTHGYFSGGRDSLNTNTIDKFPFSSDDNATDVGDLTALVKMNGGQSSSTHGYSSGGRARSAPSSPQITTDTIEKFPFSSDTDATDVGELTLANYFVAGQSSSTHGYSSGGYTNGYTNIIDKFSFATDANATDVGDLTASKYGGAGQSSTEFGYMSGGYFTNDTIEKFSFTSDGNATDVGELTVARAYVAGQQV